MDENPEFLVVFRSLHDNWAIKSDNEFAKRFLKIRLWRFFFFQP